MGLSMRSLLPFLCHQTVSFWDPRFSFRGKRIYWHFAYLRRDIGKKKRFPLLEGLMARHKWKVVWRRVQSDFSLRTTGKSRLIRRIREHFRELSGQPWLCQMSCNNGVIFAEPVARWSFKSTMVSGFKQLFNSKWCSPTARNALRPAGSTNDH